MIYGVNSGKQCICIEINWRPNKENNNKKINAKIHLRFDDNSGNSYEMNEESDVEYREREYRVCGLGLEIESPFRRKRIKFRGYLKKNNKELVYIQFRFLWFAVSKVYDFTHDFDDYFIAKELSKCQKLENSNQFEDRFEQFGQMKGTFKEESDPQKELYFWGSISKKYLSSEPIERRIIRICGFNKKG